MTVWRRLAEIVAEHGAAALVTVHAAVGSTPRPAGTRMVVRPDGAFHGSIGGGQLEWQALAAARAAIAQGKGPARLIEKVLGPDLGQCCGGRVTLAIETFDAGDAERLAALAAAEPAESRTPLLLFGAGHVGRALVLALAPLPFAIGWIDSRQDAFPAHIPANTSPIHTEDPAAEIGRARPDAFVLVMTHDHPLDLAITAEALARGFPFVGLIGSKTKRARFEKRFRDLGIAAERVQALACPIGVPQIRGKEPAVIAASVAAQLLAEREHIALSAAMPVHRRASG
ncbi:MAG TPA: xanthine dehydrogenase accessory protein XdhC [Beijerinckiaceae bacterium]|nr:xanthine dehydrogenase accessory protein XdhC [Beijerinckiaceae bacterium]